MDRHDRRLTMAQIRDYARMDIAELEVRLERAPWWVIEGDELRREHSRLRHIIADATIFLEGYNAYHC